MKLFVQTLKRTLFIIFLLILDLSLLSGAFFLAFWLRFEVHWTWLKTLTEIHTPSYWLAFGLALYLIITQLAAMNLYLWNRLRTWHEEIYTIFKAVSLTMVVLLSVSFFYRQIEFSRTMVILAWPLAVIILSMGRLSLRSFISFLKSKGFLSRTVLIYGSGGMFLVLIEKIKEHKELGLNIAGILCEEKPTGQILEGVKYLGSLEQLEDIVKKLPVDVIFITKENLDHQKTLEIIEICEKNHIELLLIPQVFDLLIGFSSLHDLHGLPMVELREEQIHWPVILVKRIFDFFASLLLFLITLPLQIVIGVLIRIDSKGPVLFSQERVGYRGKLFRMLKFRTMIPNAEERLPDLVNMERMQEPVFKLDKDPRITRLGRWLRKTSLDELPQLLNVLRGQMSLVGPRPEEVSLVKRYNVWQRRRLKIKPGITGLQQIKCRGSTSLTERVKYDIYYIRRINFLMDLEILFKTIWVVLSQKGAN